MGNNNETWFGSAIVILMFWWIFSGYFSNTHTVMVYTAICSTPIVNSNCTGKSSPSVKMYFSINKEKQEVISHTNSSSDTPIKYKNCIIADEKNWTCEYPDNQTDTPDISFSHGDFTPLGKVTELDNEIGIHYVSAFRWWLMEFGLGGGSAQSGDTTVQQPVSSYSPTTNTIDVSNSDPFPFNNPDDQYAWYDSHNVPMSNRCYTTMTSPCSNLEWAQSLGATMTPQQLQIMKLQWCQKFATSWNQTVDQCVNGN